MILAIKSSIALEKKPVKGTVMPTAEFDLNALCEAVDAQRQSRGLSWAQLERELGVSATTLRGMRERGTAEGDGVLQVLRWLGRSPESFLRGGMVSAAEDEALPAAPVSGMLRFDARAIYEALEERRIEQGMTWRQVASVIGVASAASLTRLRKGGRVSFPEVMRVFAWLGRRAARFVRITDR